VTPVPTRKESRSQVHQIKCNGFLTKPIQLQHSIRQGCPLSVLLYSLVAEPLAQLIITDRHITGIITPAQRHIKIVQFADDTNLFLKNSEQVDSVITHLDTFCRASGARVNTEKSQIMFCGSVARPPNIWGFEEAQESVKVLGVYIGSDAAAARDKSWEDLLAKLPGQFRLWKMWGLTLRGKVVMTNSLILSKLTHTLAVHDLPNAVLAKINNLITTFLWKGKSNLVAHRTIIDDYKKGGLNLIDIHTKKSALRNKIIIKHLDKNNKRCGKIFSHNSLKKSAA
uniref:Reverse transcriptase domain-containing protein n=1 Tax=Amphiprion percula TaxID=161767 RepID=A0A3P8TVS9_AMPPE